MHRRRLHEKYIPQDLAGYYDKVVESCGSGQTQAMMYRGPAQTARVECILELLSERVPRGGLCLEMGCGEGIVTARLAEMFAHVDAYDFSENMLVAARESAAKNVTVFQADATTYVPEKVYDVIVCSEVLEHVREPEAVIELCLPFCELLLVTCPVTEPENKHVFEDSLLGREQRSGDASGHIWSMDMEGLVAMLCDYEIQLLERVGNSGVALLKGTGVVPAPKARKRRKGTVEVAVAEEEPCEHPRQVSVEGEAPLTESK